MLAENCDFFMPLLHLTLPLGVGGGTIGILSYHLIQKTRMVSLPDDEKSLIICLAVSTEYWRVTHRQADRHLATV